MVYKSAEEYAELAKSKFLEGYNCSQSILIAFSDFTELDSDFAAKLSSPFGGGMGRLREVCGAVSSMFIVLGLLEGYSTPKDDAAKAELYKKVQDLAGSFEDKNGTIICRELLGLPQGKDSYIPSPRTNEYYEKRPCPDKIYSAAKILAEYLLSSAQINMED